MREITGNIWDYRDGTNVLAITTNGAISRNGRAVMGRGVAAQATAGDPELPEILGTLLQCAGNHAQLLRADLVTFPVEHSPYENPDPRLIVRSATELVALADRHGWEQIIVPRPGCGGGGLHWPDVRPLLLPYFDDRFIVIAAA